MGLDWDSLLAYNTIKVVRIRDRRLGILHLCFMICIIFYVVIYSAFLKKGYLITEEPIGSIRTSLKTPDEFNDNLAYCINSTLPYQFEKLACEYWDDGLVAFPIGDDVGFTASTRVNILNQKAYCNLKNPKCRFNTTSTENLYLADLESFTILIDHTLFAPSTQIQYNAEQLQGYILDEYGNEIQLNSSDNTVGIAGKPDIVQIKTLLEYGGINLDSPSLRNSSNSIRYDGVVALVFITYSNTYTYSTSNFKYVYSIKLVENTSYDIKEAIVLNGIDSRLLYKRHGIRLIFIQTGEIGKFNFQSLLLTLVSGLGLLTVATLIVDQLAIRFLPQRKSYSSLKFQVTDSMGAKLKKKKIIDDKGEELLYDKIESL